MECISLTFNFVPQSQHHKVIFVMSLFTILLFREWTIIQVMMVILATMQQWPHADSMSSEFLTIYSRAVCMQGSYHQSHKEVASLGPRGARQNHSFKTRNPNIIWWTMREKKAATDESCKVNKPSIWTIFKNCEKILRCIMVNGSGSIDIKFQCADKGLLWVEMWKVFMILPYSLWMRPNCNEVPPLNKRHLPESSSGEEGLPSQ